MENTENYSQEAGVEFPLLTPAELQRNVAELRVLSDPVVQLILLAHFLWRKLRIF
jgi:hypothetical protein